MDKLRSLLLIALLFVAATSKFSAGWRRLDEEAVDAVSIRAVLIEPESRDDTDPILQDTAPCGGLSKGHIKSMAEDNGSNTIIWRIDYPDETGMCTVRFSAGQDHSENFETLEVLNKDYIDENGFFECGREVGYEGAVVSLPHGVSCDNCTLQWIWKTENGSLFQCADIMIGGVDAVSCPRECANNGVCVNGTCDCADGYEGSYCQNEEGGSSTSFFTIFLIILLLIGLGIVGFLIYNNSLKLKLLKGKVENDYVKETGN